MILVGVALWLVGWPSVVVVAVLTFYQAFGLVMNGMAFVAAARGTDMHKALVVHLFFRAVAVVAMAWGLVEIARRRVVESQQTAPTDSARDEVGKQPGSESF